MRVWVVGLQSVRLDGVPALAGADGRGVEKLAVECEGQGGEDGLQVSVGTGSIERTYGKYDRDDKPGNDRPCTSVPSRSADFRSQLCTSGGRPALADSLFLA